MAHVCDSHLTTGYEFNENTASKDIFDKLEDVRIDFRDHKRVVIQAIIFPHYIGSSYNERCALLL